jgi:hypothetical protein
MKLILSIFSGALLGGLAGAIWGSTTWAPDDFFTRGQDALIFGIFFGVIGAAVGLVLWFLFLVGRHLRMGRGGRRLERG